MKRSMKIPALALVLITAIVSVECTVIDPPNRSSYRQGPVRIFDPLSLPQDTATRAPFLDPQALFADDVYVVRPLVVDAEHTSAANENNAAFVGGEQAMVSYLKKNVLQHIAPGIGWLKPPVVHFSVDAQGAPVRVELVATSGNDGLDAALIQIFTEMPHWKPATDVLGRPVEEAFEFTVGKGGC